MTRNPLARVQTAPRRNPLCGRHPWHDVEIRCIWREEYADEVWTCHGEFPEQWNTWTVYPAATHPRKPSRTMWWYGVWIHRKGKRKLTETPWCPATATSVDYRLKEMGPTDHEEDYEYSDRYDVVNV